MRHNMSLSMQKFMYILQSGTFRNLHHSIRITRDYSNKYYGHYLTFGFKKNNFLHQNTSAYRVQSTRYIYSGIQNEIVHEKEEMMALWPEIIKNLTDSGFYDDILRWIKKVFEYNIPNGKQHRAFTVITTYKELVPQDELTNENMRLIRILAWCMEFNQGFYLVIDDIADHGKMRRGQPCWYLYNDIDAAAINDGLIIEQAMYQLLKLYFRKKSYYTDLLQICHDVAFKTNLGESLDLLSTNFGKRPNLNLFTMDRYNAIVKYKSAYYTFILPVRIAMIVAGVNDSEICREIDDILVDMGHFYQVQDDFLDCYGNPELTQKSGNDIQEGKCSWMVVTALQRATPEQRKIIEDCYGVYDLEKSERVKQVYNELELKEVYLSYEDEFRKSIKDRIQRISSPSFPRDSLNKLIKRIYRRKC